MYVVARRSEHGDHPDCEDERGISALAQSLIEEQGHKTRSAAIPDEALAILSGSEVVDALFVEGAMILTSNRGFAEWGEIFGDTVVATALLDRLLHHAVVIQIEGSSYRLRQRADLVPEQLRAKALVAPPPKRRGAGREVRGSFSTTRSKPLAEDGQSHQHRS